MQHRCYTGLVPTKRKRHSITETPSVESALDELRAAAPDRPIDFGELVVLGARRKLADVRAGDASREERLERLVGRVQRGDSGIDPRAAEEVRASGWARG